MPCWLVTLMLGGGKCRKTWEYRLARRALITAAVAAVTGGLAILVACDFDDAKAAAVIRSLPRTLAAAGWCVHAAWTYKTALVPYTVSCTLSLACRQTTPAKIVASKDIEALQVVCKTHSIAYTKVFGVAHATCFMKTHGICHEGCWLQDENEPGYATALHEAHLACAERLMHLCSNNGGIYVKAAQFLASLQTVPKEYRRSALPLQQMASSTGRN